MPVQAIYNGEIKDAEAQRAQILLTPGEADIWRARWAEGRTADVTLQHAILADHHAELVFQLDGIRHQARVSRPSRDLLVVEVGGVRREIQLGQPRVQRAGASKTPREHLTAPMPARVIELLVAAGDDVAEGQDLVRIEAMKMVMTLAAPHATRIQHLAVAVGDSVEANAVLIQFAPLAPAAS